MREKGSFNKKITVIVPVYGVEDYLERCVKSIREQTYSNLEIILVDDGSKDNSGHICDRLATQDQRIRVIHKTNGGLSSARNAGIEAATGDYIGFVDSDDWIHPQMYNYLYDMICREGAQGAQIGIVNTYSYPYNFEEFTNDGVGVYSNKEILQNFMLKATSGSGVYSVCRCLFLSDVLDDIRFREGKINEDIDFKYKALSRCAVFCVSDYPMYCYFQSTGSTTTDGLKTKDFDLYDAADALYELTKNEVYGDIRFLGEVKKARTAFSLLCKIAYYGVKDPCLNKKEIVRNLTKEHRRNIRLLLKAPLPLSRKIAAILLCVHINMLRVPVCLLKWIRK